MSEWARACAPVALAAVPGRTTAASGVRRPRRLRRLAHEAEAGGQLGGGNELDRRHHAALPRQGRDRAGGVPAAASRPARASSASSSIGSPSGDPRRSERASRSRSSTRPGPRSVTNVRFCSSSQGRRDDRSARGPAGVGGEGTRIVEPVHEGRVLERDEHPLGAVLEEPSAGLVAGVVAVDEPVGPRHS